MTQTETSADGEPSRSPTEPQSSTLAGDLEAMAEPDLSAESPEHVREVLEEMVLHPEYPCLGAKSVFRRGGATHIVLDNMDDASVSTVLLQALEAFRSETSGADDFRSFVVSFRSPIHRDEAAFERSLFALLQQVHDTDDTPWAPEVARDPSDPHFAFSAGGAAYFIVGLHPAASRVARRAPLPTLVFNPHDQFERLREEGRFDTMRDRIRARDEDVQGFVNPMVADHGETSEARQYSGRYHSPGWVPPLQVEESDPR